MMNSVVSLEQQLGQAVIRLTLNRPKKLNALDLEMVNEVTCAFLNMKKEHSCVAVVMRGAGSKAFCAGGDVAAVRASGLENGSLRTDFFREEYRMNALLGSCSDGNSKIKQVSIWDGIVMGGGVGISAHGRFRVATERTMLAMPETQIGLFPDVGASFLLSKAGAAGICAALTGARLRASELLATGLATHYIPSNRLDQLLSDMSTSLPIDESDPLKFDQVLSELLKSASSTPESSASPLTTSPQLIEDAFSQSSIESILAVLDASSDSNAETLAKTLRAMSPTSLKVTLEAILRAHDVRCLNDVLTTDFRLAAHLTDPHLVPLPDFYDGVRAVLVDKDRKPKWRASLSEVTKSEVDRHFLPSPDVPDIDFSDLPL
mmetsp:Transcript_23430/g.30420  ORF Transcript_23430/g.30420 Transcript_23430/m.30420 type:complete len:376 (-) Transcript_23430:240-1367(-)